MALWPFCWNLIWVDLLLDDNRAEKFTAGMEGWANLIPDSMVGVCTMLELLGNGFNNPATTKELVTALQQRRNKGWLATLTID
eukprot:3188955-Rhodomonas_salina.1